MRVPHLSVLRYTQAITVKLARLLIISFTSILFSCASQKPISTADKESAPEYTQSKLTLLFGGDIMAHKPNFNMRNYSIIWKDIKPLVQSSDAAFANLETPVNDNEPNESFPTFNVHSSYAAEAVNAGFNVFSLANNHTNDHGLEGIRATQKWAKTEVEKSAGSGRPFYSSGIKEKNGNLSYSVFEVNGWKILFIAITEILNQPSYSNYINYIPPGQKTRQQFINKMKALRQANGCDLFIISVHSCDPEYDLTIKDGQRTFYTSLLNEAGADVVWANHAHVVKGWEMYGNKADGKLEKLIMYANGNTISGQRWDPQFTAPETMRDYTGDGILIQVTFAKKVYNDKRIQKVELTDVTSTLITTYIDSKWQFVIKKLDDAFISELNDSGFKTWAQYLLARKKLMEKIQGNTIWQ